MAPPEAVQFGDIREFFHRPVRLVGVEIELAVESDGRVDRFGQLPDGDVVINMLIFM